MQTNFWDMDDIERKIKTFLEEITGLTLVEISTAENFSVRIGTKDPVEVGFIKAKHPQVIEFRYSCYLKLLAIITDMLRNGRAFNHWLYKNR